MFKIYKNIILQQFKGASWPNPIIRQNTFGLATIAEAKNIKGQTLTDDSKQVTQPITSSRENKMVKTVFASLSREDNNEDIQTPFTDSKLASANTVDELLSISEGTGVSRKHALKVVSILSNWSSTNKVKISDFEKDHRFIRLCKVLLRNNTGPKYNRIIANAPRTDDLSTVLSVTADDEAAKLVANITLSQMVKVLTTLSVKRRRSTLLLRTLAYNIAGSTENMDIKQCADLLFSISTLNYYDENLFEKTANNIIDLLKKENIKRSAVIGSILTSVGLLKYKNPALLDALSEWVLQNHLYCRPQDIFSYLMTLAVLNYIPSNGDKAFKIIIPQLTQEEAGRPDVWLEIVWSLVLLNQANANHIQSVLNDSFIDTLNKRKLLHTGAILKLLNIDGAAHYLLENYNGAKIPPDHEIRKTTLLMTKEKSQLVSCVIDSLKNLVPETYYKTRVNTGMGFYIDAECLLDKTCNPLPLNSQDASSERIKVALLTYDYHDVCKGKIELTGINVLSQRLLIAMGYTIVSIPYTDFKVTDKIVYRVQYLENKLKEAVKQRF